LLEPVIYDEEKKGGGCSMGKRVEPKLRPRAPARICSLVQAG
jgi:hypothetical protein